MTADSAASAIALDGMPLEVPAGGLPAEEQDPRRSAPRHGRRTPRPLSRFTRGEESPSFYLSLSDLMCLLLVCFVLIFSLTGMGPAPEPVVPASNKAKVRPPALPLNLPGIDPFPVVVKGGGDLDLPKVAAKKKSASDPLIRSLEQPAQKAALIIPAPPAGRTRPHPAPAPGKDLVLDRALLTLITASRPVPARALPKKEPRLDGLMAQVAGEIKAQAAPGMEVAARKGRLVVNLPESITFDLGRAEIKPSMQPVLMRLAAVIAARGGYRVTVTGHTDNMPISNQHFSDNWDLSAARAASVARALLAQGLHQSRLGIRGLADQAPLVDNRTAANRARNRRVEIELTPTG